jgi:3-hydroxybutyryl-CoA dehydrogenase
MGPGIGQDFACAGFEVVLCDLSQEILEQAINKIERDLQEQKDWGFITAGEVQSTLDNIQTTTVLPDAAADADLVIEAVFEDLELKQRVFRELDQICPEHTILASNTSSLMPSTLASVTNRPDRVLVAHFFYPPPLMPLLEIVRSAFTSDETVAAVYDVAKAARKSPIVVQKEALGFIANRLQVALLREALYIVEQGIATAQEVDIAVKQSFGRRLSIAGPIEMAEVQDGWDLVLQVENYILPDLDVSRRPSRLIFDMVERGELGAKSGKGFYEWTEASLEAWRKKLVTTLADFAQADRGSQRAREIE